MTIYYKLPDGTNVNGNGWTLIGDLQYQLSSMSDQELASIAVEKLSFDERFYYLPESGDPVARPIEEIRTTLKAEVGNDRWTAENAGVPWHSFMAQTDRAARTNYANMVEMVRRNTRPDNAIYKFMDGPHPLANADVDQLVNTVNQYVQTLFDHEAEVWIQIDALNSVTEAEQFTWSFANLKPPDTSKLDMGPTIGETLGGSINVES